MNKNLFSILLVIATISIVISSQNACNNEMAAYKTTSEGSATSTNVPEPVPTQTQGPKTFDVKLESVSTVSVNLAEERKFKLKATAQSSFSGSMKISLDRSGLAVLDPSNDVVITPAEIPANLVAGQSLEFDVSVKTTSLARSGSGKFSFIAKPDSADYAGSVKLDFALGVNPLYEVLIMGRVNGQMVYDRGTALTSFRSHVGGLTVRYLNADKLLEHTVHGSGAVNHQNAGNPLDIAGAAGPVAGGVYEIKIMPSANASNGAYHCHIHGGTDHLLRFNVP